MSYFANIQQQVTVPPGWTTSANLAARATWTSTAESTLGVNAIQVNAYADRNLTTYVDQGPTSGGPWYQTDSLKFYAKGLGSGRGATVQAVNAYAQIRVTNTGTTPTTTLAVSGVLCPIAEPLPPALSEEGNQKVGVYEIEGDFGTRVTVSPMNALKVVESVRIAGQAFLGAGPAVMSTFWNTAATGTGAATEGGGQVALKTGTTSASTVFLTSVAIARYVGSASNTFRGVVHCPTVTGANTRQWGAFDANDGFFFEQDSWLGFSVVARKGTSDANKVRTGAFNGNLGTTYVLDTNVHTFEIYWTNSSAWFYVDGVLLHKISGATAPLCNTLHLKVGLRNANGANVNDNTLNVRTATISRLGQTATQPRYFNISTASTNVLKTAPGRIHSIVINDIAANGTITIYDNTTATGTKIGTMSVISVGVTTTPFPTTIQLDDCPFYTGLVIVTSATCDITVLYE